MTSFFPDLNVWVALSDRGHTHTAAAWNWLNHLSGDARLMFSRYTQVGLLRLLTNAAAIRQPLTVREAWSLYDQWLDDPRVEFLPEPQALDAGFREATAPFFAKPASQWMGDCYILAYAKQSSATLVTFDKALFELAQKQACPAVIPGQRMAPR